MSIQVMGLPLVPCSSFSLSLFFSSARCNSDICHTFLSLFIISVFDLFAVALFNLTFSYSCALSLSYLQCIFSFFIFASLLFLTLLNLFSLSISSIKLLNCPWSFSSLSLIFSIYIFNLSLTLFSQ